PEQVVVGAGGDQVSEPRPPVLRGPRDPGRGGPAGRLHRAGAAGRAGRAHRRPRAVRRDPARQRAGRGGGDHALDRTPDREPGGPQDGVPGGGAVPGGAAGGSGPVIRRLATADLGLDGVVAALARPATSVAPAVVARVAAIVDDVRRQGDLALVELTKRFDGVELAVEDLRVSEAEWRAATVPGELQAALAEAARRIEAFHRHQLPRSWWIRDEHGSLLGQQVTPIDRVGCYVPGGS